MTSEDATIFIALLCAAYFLPAIIAGLRGHASAWGIFALNLLLGWTGLIWIAALIWALSNKGLAAQQTVIVNNHGNEGHQPSQPVQAIYIPVPQPASAQDLPHYASNVPQLGNDTRACPSCAETIKAAAIKCRFCGEALSPTLITQGPDA